MVLYITLDKGTMFGGKSSELCRYYQQYRKKKLRLLALKHSIDCRYDGDDFIITHDRKKIPCLRVSTLKDITPGDWDVILLDEGQFFPDLYDWIERHFLSCDTRVHIAGLNGDKNQKNFGDINRISPFCSEERVHYAMCAVCGDKAPFSKFKGDCPQRILVGGDDEYYTVCARHLSTPVSEIETNYM